MQKQAPTAFQIGTIVAFSLSCFGILLYLWVAFGGSVPFRPSSYQIRVPFDEATQLAEQSDVRIDGISVGKVDAIDLSHDGRHAEAVLEIDPQYAPLPSDTKAILRAKTLLGETYVELSPGTQSGPKIPEGAELPVAQVSDPVQLDEIFRTFDAKTREGFRTWMRDAAIASAGRGVDLSNAFGQLQPTFHSFNDTFRTLDTQSAAVRALFANGETTFNALAQRRGELSGLIANADRVFAVMGRRNRKIEETFRAFPTFLDQSRLTVDRLAEFSRNTDPLVRQLTPAFKQLSPTLVQVNRLAPHFRGFMTGLRRVDKAAPRGFEALRGMLREDFPPLLVALDPFLRSLNPIADNVGQYKHEITAVFANAAAATQAKRPGEPHYLRTVPMMGPESLATFPRRLTTNRTNAYTQPGAYSQVPSLTNFETRQCTGGFTAQLDPNAPNDPNFNVRTGGSVSAAQTFFDRLKAFAFANVLDSASLPAPSCAKQAPFSPLGAAGAPTDYQHVLKQSP
jgi:phospholipid/cholesterol/gamma-HCH transport system substrate-binding protein